MSGEKIQILKMIEEGKITSEEGLKLLEALGNEEVLVIADKKEKVKWLKVVAIDAEKNANVKINIPISLVDVGLKIGSKFSKKFDETLKGIDLDSILNEVKNGAKGKILTAEQEEGKIIEIYIE